MKYCYLAVICLLFLVQGLNASRTYNFPFEDIRLYGVSENGTNERVLSTPFDFILSPQGYPIVLDTYVGKVFVFFQPYLNNYTEYNTSDFVAITIEMMAPNTYLLVTTQGIFQTTDFVHFEQINISTTGSYLLGVAYDQASNTLYVSDALNSAVNAYNLADLSLVRSYGGYTNFSKPGDTSTTSLSNPELLALDNQGGLWVVDTGNNRVLHFPAGSNVADIVLGQPNFTTKLGGAFSVNNSAQLFNPNGVALDASNQNIYVTDQTGRVLRWTAPFTNGQNASGVLDAAADLDSFNIYSVRVQNNPDGSVRVFYSDSGNGRIVSGQSVPPSPSSSPSSSATASASPTSTASLSSTSTPSLTSTSTASLSSTSTASLSATSTASLSSTSTASLSPTSTASLSGTSAASLSATSSASQSASSSASASASISPQGILPSESSSSSPAPYCPSASPSAAPYCPSASPSAAPYCPPATPSPTPASGCDCCDELRASNAQIYSQIDAASSKLATILRKLATLNTIEDEVSQLSGVNSKVTRILNQVQQLNNNNNNNDGGDSKREIKVRAVGQESSGDKKANWVNSLF